MYGMQQPGNAGGLGDEFGIDYREEQDGWELGDPARWEYQTLGDAHADGGLGVLPLLGVLKGNLVGAVLKKVPLVSGLFAKNKDPGRLQTNAAWYAAAMNGDGAALDKLYEMSGRKSASAGWATTKAKNDAWAKYQQVVQSKPGIVPVVLPASAPILATPVQQPVQVPGFVQDALYQAGVSSGLLPSPAGGPTFPGPGGNNTGGLFDKPSGDPAALNANMKNLLLGGAGVLLAAKLLR